MLGRIVFLGTVAAAMAACQSKPKVEMPPEKEDIRTIISSHAGDVSECYVTALKKNPRLSGKLVLEWEVNPIGDPKNVQVIQAVDAKMDKCIIGKLQNWAFPPPQNNQLTRVRYPFNFSPATPNDPVGVMKVQFVDASPPAVPSGKKCSVVEQEYAQLCVRDEKTGECVFDDTQMGQILRLIQDSQKLPLAYLADLDRLLKNPKPTESEGKAIMAKLNEDCWTSIHLRIWNSVLHTFKVTAGNPRVAEAKDVMRQRVTDMEVPTPTLQALDLDLTILEKGVETGFLKVAGDAKKELTALRSAQKKLAKDLASKKSSAESSTVVTEARAELKAVKPLRARLKEWSKKFWKKL